MPAQRRMKSGNEVTGSDSSNTIPSTRQARNAHAPTQRFAIEPPSFNPATSLGSRNVGRENLRSYRTPIPDLKHYPRPILKSKEPWQTWPELTIRVGNLPPDITTWNLWDRFQGEGKIVFIEIFDDRDSHRDGNAKIRFSPPPIRAFWTSNHVTMSTPDGRGAFQVRVMAEPKKRRFEIQSPIRKHIWYPEAVSLFPSCLKFGFMHSQTNMMEMYTAQSNFNSLVFKVDLLRSRIVINFQVSFSDSEAEQQAGESHSLSGELVRTNSYMFAIPFGQLQTIDRVRVNEHHWALVISLDSPPQFFRQRLDPRAGHTDGTLTWSEFDTWFRQTDIVYDPRQLESAVVSLKKERPVVDIGLWTTYYILFDKRMEEHGIFDQVRTSLQDHNIEFCDIDVFNVIPRQMATIWLQLDSSSPKEVNGKATVVPDFERGTKLPFEVRYQLEVCISRGILHAHNLTPGFVSRLIDISQRNPSSARHVLEYIAEQEKRIFDPMTIFDDTVAMAYSPKSKIPHYCAYSRKATITPTTLYFSSPTVETTNRVIRKFGEKYGDRFLRVQFTDEKFEGRINACADKARNDQIFARVYRTLVNGIRIGDRHYQFLAFGNSQFRENGAYFFCPTFDLTCADIRHWMGDFTGIKVVAKYAARLGLCFSTTRAIRSNKTMINTIEDVERNGYCFTDGVGKISNALSAMVAHELRLPSSYLVPSAFQFRLGGAKGMLANWPAMNGEELCIRKSQWKFKARYNGLEIIRCSRFSPATLNRQTITILSSLGVGDEIFNKMLSEQLSNYKAAMDDENLALDLLSRYIDDNHMTVTIAEMVLDGFMKSREPFLLSLLHLWRAWSIKLLKEKAKIIVEKGAFLLGVTDETGTLRGHKNPISSAGGLIDVEDLPQVFIQIPDKRKKGSYVVINGPCLVGRNPSLFPGDIRMVQAVDVPALHHLRDVIVFSQLGDRDVPSMCSGGDLDGDDFFCIWDKALTPTEWNVDPMSYTPQKPKELDRPVEIQDVMKFFVRYMKNDSLPTIAHAHLAMSDYLENGVKDPKCIELAELHSKAVDYVKTGEPAELPKRLRPRKWPHFMEKRYKPKEQIYVSTKILGQLYDKVESVNFVPQYESPFDERIIRAYPPDDKILKTARQIKSKYDTAMRRVMAQHEIGTEFEVWSTFVLSKPRVGSDYKLQEEMAIVSDALKDRFRKICIEAAGGKDSKDFLPFVVAMYRVTREEMQIALHQCREIKIVGGKEEPKRKMEPKYMPLITFPWLFHNTLGRIATGLEERRGLENLGFSFLSATKPKVHKVTQDVEELDPDDVVETTEGITHRGELLDLFRNDDIDSEGDEIEQPYRLGTRLATKDTLEMGNVDIDKNPLELSGSDDSFINSTVSPDPIAAAFKSIIKGGSVSRSSAELAVLDQPQPDEIKTDSENRQLCSDTIPLIANICHTTNLAPPPKNGSYLNDLTGIVIGKEEGIETNPVDNQEMEVEQVDCEIFLNEQEESPLEKLARLIGS